MKIQIIIVLSCSLLFLNCRETNLKQRSILKEIKLIGHRGARALAPENTMPAFKIAIEKELNTIEFDVVLTKDKKLIIHHDLHPNNYLCKTKTGQPVSTVAIQELTSAYMESLDCGSKKNLQFPKQKTYPGTSPITLDTLFANILKMEKENSKLNKINFLIEIKVECNFNKPSIYSDNRELNLQTSIKRVLQVIKEYKLEKRCIVQSFCLDALTYLKQIDSKIKSAALFSPSQFTSFQLFFGLGRKSISKKIITQSINLGVNYIAPNYLYINKDFIKLSHKNNLAVFAWTVNNESDMLKLLQIGIDGIITDYPGKLFKVWKNQNRQLQSR